VFRRLLLPAAAFLVLAMPAPASAIVNGELAVEGDYPAQGFLGINTDGDTSFEATCGGTLVGSRQFLTAARCAVNTVSGAPLTAASFTVRLGDVDLTEMPPDEYAVTDNDVHAGYDKDTGVNDLAMLTLARPADYKLVRVVDDSEDDLWKPGTLARVLGWGEIEGGNTSNDLLTGNVSIFTTAACAAANANFDPAAMVCAAGTGASPQDPCLSDSGSPLLASDVLAGVFSGAACSSTGAPGVYARVGDRPLNAWVHARTPEADFRFNHVPRANEPVTLTSISRHPEGAGYFNVFKWDFDQDGVFETSSPTKSVTHTFTTAGKQIGVVGLQASKVGGDKASAYFSFDVDPDPKVPPAQLGATPPPPAAKKPAVRLATISAAKRPKVRRGRFRIRVKFAKTAPRGTAVVEAFRGTRLIGIGRTSVRRGATKRVTVKLTTTGKRMLRRSASRRLQVRVRVRVGRRALRSKTLTIRR
jgi:PKD repeat protein